MNILIAEDHPTNLKLLRVTLEEAGHRALVSMDGEEAVAVLEREPVDAIISDILMPRMDGYRLCHEVRSHPSWKNLPFIFYTATYTSKGDEKLAHELGADKFLRKPATSAQLIAALQEATTIANTRPVRKTAPLDEPVVLKEYNARLISKLEQKNVELILQSTAVETSDNGIVITDTDGMIVWTNPAFSKLTGYPPEETLGKNMRLVKSGVHGKEFYKTFWQTLLAGKTWRGEFTNRRKDGTVYHDEHTVTPVRSEGGPITHFVGVLHDVTERRKNELDLRLAHAHLQQFLDHSPAVLYAFRFEGTKVNPYLVSENITRLLGFTVAEALSHNWWVWQLHRGDRNHAVESLAETVGYGSNRTEYRLRHKDGSFRWVDDQRQVVRDAAGKPTEIVGVWVDITERKKNEAALQASEKRFKALFDQAAVGVAQVDAATGLFVEVNRRFSEIMGREPADFGGLAFSAIIHPKDEHCGQDMVRQVTTDTIREFTREKRCVRKDGSEVWANVTVSATGNAGEKPDFIIAVVQDITDRKRLEEQYRQAQKMEAIGTLAGGIAHDFNNILSAVRGYTELAKMDLGKHPVVEHLNAVLSGTARAATLVGQILTFSRRDDHQRKVTQLGPIVAEAITLLRASIPPTIEFQTSLGVDVPNVFADTSQVHQIVMNLATNAAHAMHPCHGKLIVKLEDFLVDVALAEVKPGLQPGRYVRLSVSDTGHGMDAATMERIFEPFFTTKAPGEGTGLGLAVVHGIMLSHDGVISVYSHVGEGTTFHLYFPVHTGATAAPVDHSSPLTLGQGERILYLDDEAPLAIVGQKILKRFGYDAVAFTKPTDVIEAVRAAPAEVDLVITDQMMPGMMGTELARQLHAIRPELPIILTTGFTGTLNLVRLQTLGIRKLLLKPVSTESLCRLVHEALIECVKR